MSGAQRPDSPRGAPQFEIPLAGDGPLRDRHHEGGGDDTSNGSARRPDWRRLTGGSAVAGVVLGIVVATVLLTSGDDEGGDPTATTVGLDDLASALTVPPTLTPVTEPAVTLPRYPGAPVERDPGDPGVVAASVETLPPLPLDPTIPPDAFRLSDGSLAALDAAVAWRSTTDHTIGVDGFEQTIAITNDPGTERYLIELGPGGETVQSFVVDLRGGFTYAEVEPGEWATESNESIAERAGAPDMATFLRNLQLGPIRSDTREAWTLVQSSALVEGPGPEPWREWIVVLDAAAVPEWARYAFGPTGDAPPLPGGTLVGYAVYVDEGGSIRGVNGATAYGATTQRTVHRIEQLDEAPVIDLPVLDEPAREPIGEPVTPPDARSAPSTTPAG